MMSRCHALAWIVLMVSASSQILNAAPLGGEDVEFFEKQVRPVLAARCYECHSTQKKIKGGLALDTREATLKGGETGLAVVAGNPEKSLMIEAVRYKNHDLQMPPKGRLSDGEIRTLEDWIKRGAPDPRTAAVVAAPVKLQGMSVAQGRSFWSFVPLSNPRPPEVKAAAWVKSPVDAFVLAGLEKSGLHPAPAADRRTLIRRATFDLTGLPPTPEDVDLYLSDASPDSFSNVIERLLASPHYGERWGRHWLDVARYADSNGMDENIAYGHAWRYRDYVVKAFNDDKPFDQFLIEQIAGDLLPHSEDAVTATGFLSLGAKVLAEPDVQKLEMDIIDEQIDTIGKAFMGMTLGCVRCHDHKFDPITQEDYYALAAIFRSTRSLSEAKGVVKFWHERSLATPQQLQEKGKFDEIVKGKKAEVTAFITKARNEVKTRLQRHAADYLAAAALLPAGARLADAALVSSSRQLDADIVMICRQFLDQHPDHPVFAAWRELALKKDADGVRRHYEPVFAGALKTKKGPAYEALVDVRGFLALPVKDADVLDAATLVKITALNAQVKKLEGGQPDLPAIMSVTEADIVKTLPVHIRGSHLTLGKPVERGFPEVMSTSFTKPVMPAKHSGRLELARWMASSDHPLTARVMVNRVWRWHFGQGIVSSTDNFGILGGKPSHPELLDWLSRNFIGNAWSIKDLHRLIMKSAAYQQASSVSFSKADKADARLVDPENRLLWRANIQRLEAEEIRDAMLATSGRLSPGIGGKTMPLRNKDYVSSHAGEVAATYDSPRRTMYLPIIRNSLYDLLEQFDYPDNTTPTGSRNSTVIAPQALIMMNAPVVMECSTRLAARLASLPDDEERVRQIHALLYSRPPAAGEMADALAFVRHLSATGKPERAWALLCQALLSANEFIYLK